MFKSFFAILDMDFVPVIFSASVVQEATLIPAQFFFVTKSLKKLFVRCSKIFEMRQDKTRIFVICIFHQVLNLLKIIVPAWRILYLQNVYPFLSYIDMGESRVLVEARCKDSYQPSPFLIFSPRSIPWTSNQDDPQAAVYLLFPSATSLYRGTVPRSGEQGLLGRLGRRPQHPCST
jgi:hypothetical protein